MKMLVYASKYAESKESPEHVPKKGTTGKNSERKPVQ